MNGNGELTGTETETLFFT